MYNCSSIMPRIQKIQDFDLFSMQSAEAPEAAAAAPAMPFPPMSPMSPMTPLNPMTPTSPIGPDMSSPFLTDTPTTGSMPPMTMPGPDNGNILRPITPTPTRPSSPLIPNILPNSPSFTVPSNPLLPPGYQEVLDYESIQYLNGFLRTQIGRNVQVDFLVGSNSMVSKFGKLVGVGLNYILLQENESNDIISCDFYNIKFVRFYY